MGWILTLACSSSVWMDDRVVKCTVVFVWVKWSVTLSSHTVPRSCCKTACSTARTTIRYVLSMYYFNQAVVVWLRYVEMMYN